MATELSVSITSFSYRLGLPLGSIEHGGGFIFDCRGIKNPGREERYRSLCGLDQDVAKYLAALPTAKIFFDSALKLVELTIESYLARGFSKLEVAFGCTGGQHRSVYFGELLARHLGSRKGVAAAIVHRDLPPECRRSR